MTGVEYSPEFEQAITMAEKFITKSLKAPSTAKFQDRSEVGVIPEKNGIWKVYTEVDSQNSYGAMLRSKMYVKMKKNGEHWKLIELKQW